ncbi:Leucine-rich repeat cysteine-containing subtype [Arabidopsis thaliana x Arabidopsis arenosa]|uniref:Leucine-rich repeat cysteine-containing subtype n=1 Tax=Arabidopsis thaliana x Arabidopsis arenosa TaxID=1240361 RepID=A0A8T2ADQ8_9BRAS|nr:Leucine-rich repeat cysteine-containing subtype [Arabidopsis thaliana x Arabidopsis arenosa]
MASSTTTLSDLPDVILSTIFSLVSDSRARNSLSLVSHKFLALERSTRSHLTLRGNARDLSLVPGCFRSISHLDLSFLSPWGHTLLASLPIDHQNLLALRLKICFPSVVSLNVYSRSPSSLELLLPQWPRIRHIKLLRWHQRASQIPIGGDFVPIFEHCGGFLESLDLSAFYHWTEDLPPVLLRYADVAARLTRLDLLTASFTEGYKSSEIVSITKSCPNLKDFRVACTFDPRYFEFVGDETLSAVATNCPKLTLLHMVDTASLANPRAIPGTEAGDSAVTAGTLIEVFSGLPNLEELVLDVGKDVKHSGVALEALNSKCKKLRALKLGQFQGVCSATEWRRFDGVALCGGLQSLSIKNSGDLTDMGLVAIGRGCCRLTKFEIQGCENVTVDGLRTMVSLRRKTLTDVRISCCKNLDATASLKAVEPICDRIKKLHIDCVWSGSEEEVEERVETSEANHEDDDDDYERSQKRCKYSLEEEHCSTSDGNGFCSEDRVWEKLEYLSLWISVGEFLTPLPMTGLDDCPNLEEIRIKIEGDCRGKRRPAEPEFGLSCLALYPKLSKMQLDCGDTIGFALTAPPMQMDLSLWERFFLTGIGSLSLSELDYWPPQDRDVNQRSLSLPGAGLLQECLTLRKLFIHGTAHEHFMNFLLRIPNLRDVQLRADYYPAPENDMSTEMRVGSCSRFEDQLNSRNIID